MPHGGARMANAGLVSGRPPDFQKTESFPHCAPLTCLDRLLRSKELPQQIGEGTFLEKHPRSFEGKARVTGPGSLICEAEGGERLDTHLLGANRRGFYSHYDHGKALGQIRPLA